jgi:hypothetical protein
MGLKIKRKPRLLLAGCVEWVKFILKRMNVHLYLRQPI